MEAGYLLIVKQYKTEEEEDYQSIRLRFTNLNKLINYLLMISKQADPDYEMSFMIVPDEKQGKVK